MDGREIWHEVRIAADRERVWDAITQPAAIERWWIPDVSGETRVGGALIFRVNERFAQHVEVTAVEPPSRLIWRPLDDGNDDWQGSQIEFRLSDHPIGTALQFCHSNYKPDVAAFPYYSQSWALYLLSLRALLETGEGFPIAPDGKMPQVARFTPRPARADLTASEAG